MSAVVGTVVPMPPVLTSPLVSTQWLADHLGADDMVVVDTTVLPVAGVDGTPTGRFVTGREGHRAEHVPGAVFADLIRDFSDADAHLPFTRPDRLRFEDAVGALGISNDTTVVVYDDSLGEWACRLWWLFRAFGYDDVAVLDGGAGVWRDERRPVERGHVEPEPTLFEARERPELWVDKAFVERVVAGDETAALVCASPSAEFAGTEGRRPRRGHIPGSLSAPASTLVDGDHQFRPDAQLKSIFAPVSDAARVVVYCGGGITASADAFALTLIGERNVALYDGSLNEWSADPGAPLESLAA